MNYNIDIAVIYPSLTESPTLPGFENEKGADFGSFKKSLHLFIFHKRKNFKGKKKAKTVVTII
jgi:hypothetical protein